MFENEIINNWEKKQEAQLFQEELIAMMSTMLMRVISKQNETKSREIKNWWIDECDKVRNMMNTKNE
ncbi:MAG: hypothetical protein QQN51_06930 [Nitrosopumilus sp.]